MGEDRRVVGLTGSTFSILGRQDLLYQVIAHAQEETRIAVDELQELNRELIRRNQQ